MKERMKTEELLRIYNIFVDLRYKGNPQLQSKVRFKLLDQLIYEAPKVKEKKWHIRRNIEFIVLCLLDPFLTHSEKENIYNIL